MWSFPIKNELNRTKIDEIVTETKFDDRKGKASSGADTFLKIGKNMSKVIRCAPFFYFVPNYGSSGASR